MINKKTKNTPKRIVSLVPSQTELLCDLALENELVGITKFCLHPYHLKSTKPIVGGTKKNASQVRGVLKLLSVKLFLGVFPLKLINTTSCIYQHVFTSEKRVRHIRNL